MLGPKRGDIRMLQKLPLDISTFAELRAKKYLYVDKTKYAYDLIMGGRRFFLSRPRRFGKSLFISTLKEILSGNRDLFNDLWIGQEESYPWTPHGVITLDFSNLSTQSLEECKHDLIRILAGAGRAYGIILDMHFQTVNDALERLVLALYEKFGSVAILIDEYDRPILHNLHNVERACAIRALIQDFFTAVKGHDQYINFVFITGVSSFTKAGLFSGMNNLLFITLDKQYARICGYTDEEVDHYFVGHIQAWADKQHVPYAKLRQEIKTWYNGYHFNIDVPSVYNPFSLMYALHKQDFENFWFQSGTMTFLVEELKKEARKHEYQVLNSGGFEEDKESLGIFDVGAIPLPTLMFQTGYLTLSSYDQESKLYKLDYPNLEVKSAFQKYLLEVFARLDAPSASRLSAKFRVALNNCALDKAITLLQQLFAHVPYQLHMPEEKFYHALLQMVCTASGMNAQSEYSTDHGRIDVVLDLPNVLYVAEIKFNKSAKEALAQIEEHRYYERFLSCSKPIMLLGISFKRQPGIFEIEYDAKQMK